MRRISRIFIAFSLTAGGVSSAHAQDDNVTPRQVFTSFVSGIPVEDLRYKPFEIPPTTQNDLIRSEKSEIEKAVSLLRPAPEVPIVIRPVLPEMPEIAPSEKVEEAEMIAAIELSETPLAIEKSVPKEPDAERSIISKEASLPPAPKEALEQKAEKTEEPPFEGSLLPFYVSAEEYLKARQTGKHEQMTLTYTVTVSNAKSGLSVDPKIMTLVLGPDYAAITKDQTTQIYDFKMTRLLTVYQPENLIPTQSPEFFSSVSLYPIILNNVDTVKKATRNGTRDVIKIGHDTELDAFWMEAGTGWSARSNINGLKVTRNENDIKAAYKDTVPLTLRLGGPDIPTDDHMRVLYAYWLHDIPIHPGILPKIGRPGHAPSSITLLSYNPKYPDGLKTKWTLTGSNVQAGTFPLSADMPTALEVDQTTPLAFVIAESAAKTSENITAELEELQKDMAGFVENDDGFLAWVTGQTLGARLGGCAYSKEDLCDSLNRLENAAKPSSDLARVSNFLANLDIPAKREAALEGLLPYTKDELAPAFLLKKAGMARARVKTSRLTSETIKSMKADYLLEKALIKDPLDPETYHGLSQIYAARGNFTESWDLLDALRHIESAPDTITTPVGRVEQSLKIQAPGYFIATHP
ncbi:MAG: hypothetical protein ACSHXY_12505 [Alphaproteobacteria bacterium]